MQSRMSPRVLVVEDDPEQANRLRRSLRNNGFDAACVNGLKSARLSLAEEPADLVLLDLNLKDGSGRQLLAEIQAKGVKTAVMIVSAVHEISQQLRAFEEGADDYLKKPFHEPELIARVQAILRRTFYQTPGPHHPESVYEFGAYQLDLANRCLRFTQSPDRKSIPLAEKSFAILRLLVSHPYQLLSRERIAAAYFGRDHVCGSRSIDVEIAKLRKSIEPDPAHPIFIRTSWGKGYLFTPA